MVRIKMIEGVCIKELKTNNDERGYFREIIRVTDDLFKAGFGQLSQSMVYTGVIKAWHIHKVQTDVCYVVTGVLKIALHDLREKSSSFKTTMDLLMGDDQPPRAIVIPPGVAHGYKCICGPAVVFYITSHIYNPDDEGRIPHDDPAIGYNWLQGPEIK